MSGSATQDWYRDHYACTEVWPHLAAQLARLSCGQRDGAVPVRLAGPARSRRISAVKRVVPRSAGKTSDFSASLVPDRDGFVVLVNADHPSTRQRFSVAHEIVHTFFYDIDKTPPMRPPAIARPDEHEERLCDRGAAELLVPTDALKKRALVLASGAEAVVALATEFDVSTQVMARRLVEDDLWPGVTIVLLRWIPEGESGKPDACRVLWAAERTPFTVPEGCSVHTGELVIDACKRRTEADGETDLELGRLAGPHHVSCTPVPGGSICVIAAPNHDGSTNDQLTLI